MGREQETTNPSKANLQFLAPDSLAQIRHDFRTPINHIIGYSEMLKEEAEDQGHEDLALEFQLIRLAGRRLLQSVTEALDSATHISTGVDLDILSRQLRKPLDEIVGYTIALQEPVIRLDQPEILDDLTKIRTAVDLIFGLMKQAPFTSTASVVNARIGPTSSSKSSPALPTYVSPVVSPASAISNVQDVMPTVVQGFILVVDDNETNRDMLCRRLERQGYRVALARGGQEAIQMVNRDHFDLILLDVMMPDISGLEVLQHLKSQDSFRHIPIVMLSAVDEFDSAVRCIEMGAEDYLSKPFDPVLLKARLDASLEKKQLRDQEVRYLQEIESINSDLEKRVEARVSDLEKSNQQLTLEIAQRRLLEQQLQENMAEMAVVDGIARIVTSTLEVDQVYEQFALEMRKFVDFDRVSINYANKAEGTYSLLYLFGDTRPGRTTGDVAPLTGTQTERVVQTGQTEVVDDIAEHAEFEHDQDYRNMGLRSNIMVPLISKGQAFGTLSLRSRRVGAYGTREREILERLAKQIAPSVENARLYEETSKEKELATTTLAQLRALLDGVDAGILLLGNDDETVLWANQRFAEFFGINDPASLMNSEGGSNRLRQISQPCLANPEEVLDNTDRIIADRTYSGTEELRFIYPVQRTIRRFTTPVYDEQREYLGRLWLHYDVSDQRGLEEQLQQSQKLESIGRLAGGIAHDFNNLLTPIMGYATLGLTQLTPDHPAQGHLEEVKKAAERASNLTHQLLAFSRGQIIEPRVVDLNELVLNMDELLRRLIGEHIEFVTLPAPELNLVKVDPGQIEQVLLNLVINARDAMPQGGKLTVATANICLEEVYARQHPNTAPGQHVTLSVSDNGTGMSQEVKAHVFEPFFTTKELGKGTGLGLATCYGIVKQSGGFIEVDSEVGKGTIFKVYLPKTIDAPALQCAPVEDHRLPRGTETVLLAEDEPAVRSMIATVLQNQGYTVLQASNGDEALRVAEEYPQKDISLLLTDVVMPQMGGVELASRFSSRHPNSRIIFTSGYSNQPIVTVEGADPGIDFIQKPFMPAALAFKVREVLDQ